MLKKFYTFLVLFLMVIFPVASQTASPIDLIVILDTSSSMNASYRQVNTYVTGPFLREFLRLGDTFHLISFSDTPRTEVVRRIEGVGDMETIIGRLFLMYPLEPYTDIGGALDYAERYIAALPASRQKQVVLITDGDHNPRPGAPTLDAAALDARINAAAARLRQTGAEFHYIRVPLTGNGPSSGRIARPPVSPVAATPTPAPARTAPPAAATSSPQTAPRTTPSPAQPAPTANSTPTAPAQTPAPAATPTPAPARTPAQAATPAQTPAVTPAPARTATTPAATPSPAQAPIPARTPAPTPARTTSSETPAQAAAPAAPPARTPARTTPTAASTPAQTPSQTVTPAPPTPTPNPGTAPNLAPTRTPSPAETPAPAPTTTPVPTADLPPAQVAAPAPTAAAPTKAPVVKPVRTIGEQQGVSPIILFTALGLFLILGIALVVLIRSRRLHRSPRQAMAYAAGRKTPSKPREAQAAKLAPDIKNGGDISAAIKSGAEHEPPVIFEDRNPMIALFVDDQNTNIGRRNVHSLKAGNSYTLGGGKSDYLIFLVPLPPHIGELRFDGKGCTFVPTKPHYFPDIGSEPVPNCIGKTIRVVSDRDYQLTFRMQRYENPLTALNQLMQSINVSN